LLTGTLSAANPKAPSVEADGKATGLYSHHRGIYIGRRVISGGNKFSGLCDLKNLGHEFGSGNKNMFLVLSE
jgi:hypothetical protein|tara:strand:+ start:934 stop:1149 length:216 start_codon:yes stop_codon:yes gene_type:complete